MAISSGGTLLVVLGALVIGSVLSAGVHIEGGLERLDGNSG